MSDTARDIQPPDLVSTDGLDALFELDANTCEMDASESALVRETGATGSLDVREHGECVSVEDAAALLGISIRAVQKRLKRGTLKGTKTKYGSTERWLVQTSSLLALKSDPSIVSEYANLDQVDAPKIEVVRDVGAGGAAGVRERDASINDENYKDALIKDLQNQLQAASWRNGYLESKLEERDIQIKLLTDSQHKPSWWQRFKAFFVK